VKVRGKLTADRGDFRAFIPQHLCLQTSCCDVQLRLHCARRSGCALAADPAIPPQLFRQLIADESQLIWHDVVVRFNDGGGAGTGVTV
jgi:hypothetical protein